MDKLEQKTYFAIDLKSFFASVECVERGLNPLTTHLVVADESRTEKTICLAVTPSLKAYGIKGRARLFEIVQKVKEINQQRLFKSPSHNFKGKSVFAKELEEHPEFALDYIVAAPRMAYYIKYSTRIFGIYLRYIQPQDIHPYSIDEVFIDATSYLKLYGMSAHDFALKLVREVLHETGITATAGIGSNLYLAKVAMDIMAKHMLADKDGVRIAQLDETSYRKLLWDLQPITKFWRVGPGTAERLKKINIFTMGGIARQSVRNEDVLYKMFGVNAELLIDHAWGYEPCTIADIKVYKPEKQSISRGQVLHEAYSYEKARTVMYEMAEQLALELLEKHLSAKQLTVMIGYDHKSLQLPNFDLLYHGPIIADHYGRNMPKPAHATMRINEKEFFSRQLIVNATLSLFDKCINKKLLIRRLNLTASDIKLHSENDKSTKVVQLDLFTNYEALEQERSKAETKQKKEQQVQKTILQIKKKFGKNAILKGINFAEGATMIDRNKQIGGHKA